MRGAFSSLRARLLLLIVLVTLPAFGIALLSGLEQRRLAAAGAQSDALRRARLASSDQQQLVEETRQRLLMLSYVPMIRDGDVETCNAVFRAAMPQYRQYTNLAVIHPNGDMWCSGTPMNGRVNVADRRYFQRILTTREFSIGDYVIGRVSGKATLLTGFPLLDEAGAVRAVIHAGLDLTWLNRFAHEARLPAGSHLSVTDQTGTVLVRYPSPEEWVGWRLTDGPIATVTQTGEHEAIGESTGPDGVARLSLLLLSGVRLATTRCL